MASDWKNSPTCFEQFNGEHDYMLFIDETGVPTLKNYNQNNRWFSMTGILIAGKDGEKLISDIMAIKHKYWKNAMFNEQRVVFHSRDYRKKVGAFNPKIIDYPKMNLELLQFVEKAGFTIFSSGIDKDFLTRRYNTPYPVYWFSLLFLIERYAIFLENHNKTGVIILEARGKKEDNELLQAIVPNIEYGTNYVSDSICSRIRGVYFNNKRTENKKQSYPYLEMADMIGYELHNKISKGVESDFYRRIESKIYNYPNITGYGLKIFDR
ncbi:DUF3800 domain-containing protein [Streptococcus ovuberis]|uniref:DUF3800 domain-containing protein n=1 Tax=Streptococcus ovuberis TaxID=1936207 RepID=A0A7X6MYS1_9STRE|nr:DUF3800 domain-containing protein [Streptococcus ovuberis]NKZ20865.1 DUF3800 domain-containing protein [Streptococcus ovuberis]